MDGNVTPAPFHGPLLVRLCGRQLETYHYPTGSSSLRPSRVTPRPLSADFPDWCSDITAVCFEIPPTLRALGGTAHVAELLAIQAGLHLLSSRRLRGTVYSDCLSAVKKITRRWSPGQGFQEAGAPLVSSCRAYLSDTISLKWTKGHPERFEHPPSTWSRQQWGIYLADAVSKNRDIRSLPHSPIPILRTHSVSLYDSKDWSFNCRNV